MSEQKRSSAPREKAVRASEESGCKFVAEWKLLTSLEGMTPVWIPDEMYERVAASFLTTKAEDEYATGLLRARMAPMGVWHTCKGTCSGGWCKEVILQPDELSALSVCECSYFV
jgi:hypothetical protein